MITLVLDGAAVMVAAFCAAADARQEAEGCYRLDVLHHDGSSERCWATAAGVQDYRRLQPCGGGWPW